MNESGVRQQLVNATGLAIAAANTALLFYICWGLFNRQFTIDIKDPLMMVLGVLLAKHGDILQWAFGSSSQAKKQTDTIDALAKTAQTTSATAALAAAPTSPDSMVIPQGGSATATSTPAGTVLKTDPPSP